MRKIRSKKIHNTTLLFIILAPFTILFYASYVFNPLHMGNIWLYLLQITADAIAIINIGALWVTILLDMIEPEYNKRQLLYNSSWIEKNKLKIAVFVPVTKEPYEIIEKTVTNAKELDYPHETYLLDDGPSIEAKNLAERLKIHYIARPPHKKSYAKSGNINYGLQQVSSDFFAVFDADHVPKKTFLIELLPFFENKNVALVQTPQHYTNTKNFIASGTSQAQEIFYKYVQPAKNSYNASFCVGTNMLFRTEAIREIGGIVLLDHSEDIWTTMLLHEKKMGISFLQQDISRGSCARNNSIIFPTTK